MITRWAEREDLGEVYAMYIAALRETNEPHDEKKALDFMLMCWAKAPCILLIEDGNIIGFAGLNTYQPDISNERYIRDYMFYVKPSHRGIKAWRILCKAVQATADEFKLPFIGEHRLSGDIQQHIRLIKMAGAKPFAIMSVYGGKNE